jgi:hypothetical protein
MIQEHQATFADIQCIIIASFVPCSCQAHHDSMLAYLMDFPPLAQHAFKHDHSNNLGCQPLSTIASSTAAPPGIPAATAGLAIGSPVDSCTALACTRRRSVSIRPVLSRFARICALKGSRTRFMERCSTESMSHCLLDQPTSVQPSGRQPKRSRNAQRDAALTCRVESLAHKSQAFWLGYAHMVCARVSTS